MSKKLFLLDAMALIYRAYYALIRNPRLTTEGKNTNAQFGFTNALLSLLDREKPTHIAVAFDTHAPTTRHDDFEAYKANREDTPEDIIKAVPDIKRILKGFQIPCIELDGYEADDIIGTLAVEAAEKGYTVYMVTPDKDYGQLVTTDILMYVPANGKKKEAILGTKEICEKWDIAEVSQVIDVLGLMGDAVDNIPGVPGVGAKTASKLLKKYHSVEGLLAAADQIKGKLGEKIRANKEQALLSKRLATIIKDVPIDFKEDQLLLSEPDTKELESIFRELEFRSLGKRVLGSDFSITMPVREKGGQLSLFGNTEDPSTNTIRKVVPSPSEDAFNNLSKVSHEYELIDTEKARKQLIQLLLKQKEIAFDTETTGIDSHTADLVGMSFSHEKGKAYYVPLPPDREDCVRILEEFKSVFEKKELLFIGHNLKYDLLMMLRYGFNLQGALFDTLLAHYLIDPAGRSSMDILAYQYLQYKPVPITDLIGKKGKNQKSMGALDPKEVYEYACEDADITLQLKAVFAPLLKENAVEKVFYEIEMPLLRVLTAMELEGVKVDQRTLAELSNGLSEEIDAAEQKVFDLAGIKFNLASPKQLGEVLFDRLKLVEKPKKTRTGQYATGEDVLKKLAPKHEIIEEILTYREISKLKSTYVDALPQLINNQTGRIHTSYNQAVAVTGRLSSNNPNLQNIPIRTERGRSIRQAFVPGDDSRILMSADYSQVELRIIASISGDEHMIAAFKEGQDIHAATAAKVYKIAIEEVSREMRGNAKSVNFGIIYGVSAFGLSQNLNISRTEAKELIDNYFVEYPAIKKYMEDQVAFAKAHGYVESLLGRKRWLSDIQSSNAVVRGYAERNAINMPIQGTAADMIKLAMIKIEQAFEKEKVQSKMIMQVHDELVFDTLKEEADQIEIIVRREMEQAMKLEVPLKVDIGRGKNWLEAH